MSARENNTLAYLSEVHDNSTEVKVYLTNGTMLRGYVVEYDQHSIVLDKCLVLLRNIISMAPVDN